jgi:hemolysin activation/secretion protein
VDNLFGANDSFNYNQNGDRAGSIHGTRGGTKQVSYDLFVSWPLREPAGFASDNPTYGFQCTYQI